MYEVRKTAEAEEDLGDIWVYHRRERGAAEADRYVDDLEADKARLTSQPKLGKAREHLRRRYCSLATGRHVAYYTIDESIVWIIRVLHGRMEPEQHL